VFKVPVAVTRGCCGVNVLKRKRQDGNGRPGARVASAAVAVKGLRFAAMNAQSAPALDRHPRCGWLAGGAPFPNHYFGLPHPSRLLRRVGCSAADSPSFLSDFVIEVYTLPPFEQYALEGLMG
jgi:hypothetical protein